MGLFRPIGETQRLNVAASQDRIELLHALDVSLRTIRIYNDSNNVVFVALGGSDVVAALPAVSDPASGIPLPPNRETGFDIGDDGDISHLSAICVAGETATIYITIGVGV